MNKQHNTDFIAVDEHTVTLNISEYYTFQLEFLWFGIIAHSTVNGPYNKTVLKQYKHDIELMATCLSQPFYSFQTPSHDPKKQKFIERLGFNLDHFRYTQDGEKAKFYRYQPLLIERYKINGKPIQEQN